MELDMGQLLNTLLAGGALWAAIRVEIRYLWRDVDRLHSRVEGLEKKH